MNIQAWLAEKLKIADNDTEPGAASIESLLTTLAEREVALAATERGMAERVAAAKARLAEEARLRAEARGASGTDRKPSPAYGRAATR
jgi:hypothetical protein